MIEVLLFASIRESLGVERVRVAVVTDVDALIGQLVQTHGAHWASVLRAPDVIVAVNQEVAASGCRLRDGDEVAFFPPVTGG